METAKTRELASLLEETGHAHHQAFLSTDGNDPDWAIWYAGHLQKPLSSILGKELTKSRIIYELVRLADAGVEEGSSWPDVYARDLIGKYC